MPKQLDFILSDKLKDMLFGGFGAGKTEPLCWRAIVLALRHPKSLGLLGRNTYPELRDSTMRSFFEVCPPELIKDFNKQENKVTFQNDAQMLFRAFDDPRKVLSMNLGWFGIDQIEEISEEMYLQLFGRLRDKSCRLAFGVGNPEPNWCLKRFKNMDGKDVDLFFQDVTTFDNPHLPPDYAQNLIKNYPDFWIKRYVYGDWNTFEGQIFSEFVEAKNVIFPFEIPKTWQKEFVIDYGYRNPLACLKFAIDYDDNYYVVDEHYEREKVISWHADRIKELGYSKDISCLIDPSCKAKTRVKNDVQVSIIDEFMEFGIYPIPASNDRAGILRVNELFKSGRLKIFRNCVNTIQEVKEWRWKKVRPDWNKSLPEEPEDKNDHCCDDLVYFVNNRPQPSKKPKPENWAMEERRQRFINQKRSKVDAWYDT